MNLSNTFLLLQLAARIHLIAVGFAVAYSLGTDGFSWIKEGVISSILFNPFSTGISIGLSGYADGFFAEDASSPVQARQAHTSGGAFDEGAPGAHATMDRDRSSFVDMMNDEAMEVRTILDDEAEGFL